MGGMGNIMNMVKEMSKMEGFGDMVKNMGGGMLGKLGGLGGLAGMGGGGGGKKRK
jgi:hypothetical protein